MAHGPMYEIFERLARLEARHAERTAGPQRQRSHGRGRCDEPRRDGHRHDMHEHDDHRHEMHEHDDHRPEMHGHDDHRHDMHGHGDRGYDGRGPDAHRCGRCHEHARGGAGGDFDEKRIVDLIVGLTADRVVDAVEQRLMPRLERRLEALERALNGSSQEEESR